MSQPSLPPSTDVAFWEHFYHQPEIPWDLGEAAPPFAHWLQHSPTFQKMSSSWRIPPKMAALGCGQGHDAALFAISGFDVTGFDYAPSAIEFAQQRHGLLINEGQLRFQQADCLAMAYATDAKATHAAFDWVLEHTFFCAIKPKQRPEYIETVLHLLKPGGYFLGLFFNHGQPSGPPYDTPKEAIETMFPREAHMHCLFLEQTPHSHPKRQNQEWLALFQRQPSA